jgi:hypothetical protein
MVDAGAVGVHDRDLVVEVDTAPRVAEHDLAGVGRPARIELGSGEPSQPAEAGAALGSHREDVVPCTVREDEHPLCGPATVTPAAGRGERERETKEKPGRASSAVHATRG